jgi:hypothetical protein
MHFTVAQKSTISLRCRVRMNKTRQETNTPGKSLIVTNSGCQLAAASNVKVKLSLFFF